MPSVSAKNVALANRKPLRDQKYKVGPCEQQEHFTHTLCQDLFNIHSSAARCDSAFVPYDEVFRRSVGGHGPPARDCFGGWWLLSVLQEYRGFSFSFDQAVCADTTTVAHGRQQIDCRMQKMGRPIHEDSPGHEPMHHQLFRHTKAW